MSKTERGGPAFPTQEQRFPDGVLNREAEYGMTLRDYFAAHAISFVQWNKGHTGLCAERCYEIADAMLEARK